MDCRPPLIRIVRIHLAAGIVLVIPVLVVRARRVAVVLRGRIGAAVWRARISRILVVVISGIVVGAVIVIVAGVRSRSSWVSIPWIVVVRIGVAVGIRRSVETER